MSGNSARPQVIPADPDAESVTFTATEFIKQSQTDQTSSSCCEGACAEGATESEADEKSEHWAGLPSWSGPVGIRGYGYFTVYGQSRLIAVTRNYGSAQAQLNQGRRCYGGNLAGSYYYNGAQMVVQAPCSVCYLPYPNVC